MHAIISSSDPYQVELKGCNPFCLSLIQTSIGAFGDLQPPTPDLTRCRYREEIWLSKLGKLRLTNPHHFPHGDFKAFVRGT